VDQSVESADSRASSASSDSNPSAEVNLNGSEPTSGSSPPGWCLLVKQREASGFAAPEGHSPRTSHTDYMTWGDARSDAEGAMRRESMSYAGAMEHELPTGRGLLSTGGETEAGYVGDVVDGYRHGRGRVAGRGSTVRPTSLACSSG
jgi:hypothetical protein